MAEFHTTVTTTDASPENIMYNIYNHVVNASNTYIGVVSADGNLASRVDSTGNNTVDSYAAPTSKAFYDANEAYLVIEPATAYPGGGNWQLELRKGSDTDFTYELVPAGGWSSSGSGTFGAAVTTGHVGVYASVPTMTKIHISSATETYNSTYTYTYFRLLVQNGANDCLLAFYCGGYIPFAPTSDTKPVCVLAGKPHVDTNGFYTAAYNGRVPTTYAHGGMHKGYLADLGSTDTLTGKATDRDGNAVSPATFLFTEDSKCLGTFGPNTMRACAEGIDDWSIDSSGYYIVTGTLLHRFREYGT